MVDIEYGYEVTEFLKKKQAEMNELFLVEYLQEHIEIDDNLNVKLKPSISIRLKEIKEIKQAQKEEHKKELIQMLKELITELTEIDLNKYHPKPKMYEILKKKLELIEESR